MRGSRASVGWQISILVLTSLSLLNVSVASANEGVGYKSELKSLLMLAKSNGFPVRDTSGAYSKEAMRTLCAMREIFNGKPSRDKPVQAEILSLKEIFNEMIDLSSITPPAEFVNGFNVSVKCQIGYFVSEGSILRIVTLSSGKLSTKSRVGLWRVGYRINDWKESSLYPGGWMYKPSFYNGNEAVHGMKSDSLVPTYPASHGCIRVMKRDMDWLYPRLKNAQVYIYGKW
jgi:hypothetical protein